VATNKLFFLHTILSHSCGIEIILFSATLTALHNQSIKIEEYDISMVVGYNLAALWSSSRVHM
jgi:hypothetical protein